MKQRLQNMDIKNKRIVLRCDFNVPIKDGDILDDTKIKQSLKTINYLIDNNCKIVILSHLGKIKKEEDKISNSLEPIAKRLNELLSTNVIFSKQTRSNTLDERVNNLNPKDVLLIENTRFEDIPEKLESSNNIELASYWASFGDVFVMDAFASSHRAHASTCGIAKFIPSCIGFLVQKELEMLNKYCLYPRHPFTIIMGGAKIDDKLDLMCKLLNKCDYMLLTGGLANSCLKVLGLNIGSSLATNNIEVLNKVRSILYQYSNKIILPLDVIVGTSYDKNYVIQKKVNMILDNDSINDIGTETLNKYQKIINLSNTIFLNGTAGIYEDIRFANGTKELLRMLADSKKDVIVGGGDAISSVNNFGYKEKFTYLSTGGGATLEYLVNEHLDALDIIPDEVEEL